MTRIPSRPTRRAVLAGLGLLPLAGCAAQLGLEPALPRRTYRDLRIDVAPMVRKGVPNWAARVAAAVRPAARRAFADMIDPNDRRAPVLVLEIDAVNFPIYVAGWDRFPLGSFGADDATDWLDGWVVAGTTRRRVAVTSPAARAGAWYLPDIDQRRLDRLAETFAWWARKEFGA